MTWFGKPFLEASIGSVLRRLCAEKVAIEVDPMRSGKSTKDVERNVEHLIYWCQEFWNQIYSVRAACPKFVCLIFHISILLTKCVANFELCSRQFESWSNSDIAMILPSPNSTTNYDGRVFLRSFF